MQRRRRALVWAAAFFIFLRALVPAGFMLSVGAAGAAVTLCPEYAAPVTAAAAPHEGHASGHEHGAPHHHDHASAGVPHSYDHASAGTPHQADSKSAHLAGADSHGICPFAAAAHGQWHAPDAVGVFVTPHVGGSTVAASPDAALPSVPFCLSRSPRGPPVLSLV